MISSPKLVSILLGFVLLPFSTQAALLTYDNEAGFVANGGVQLSYDFEAESGFPLGSYDPSTSLIGEFDGIVFDAMTIIPLNPPRSGVQGMSGAEGTFSRADLDFSGLGRRVTGFGFYAMDLDAGEFVRVEARFRLGGNRIFDVRLGDADVFTPIFFGAYDRDDSILGLSLSGIDDSGNLRAWYVDDLTLISEVPLPSALPLFLGGLLLLGRFHSRCA